MPPRSFRGVADAPAPVTQRTWRWWVRERGDSRSYTSVPAESLKVVELEEAVFEGARSSTNTNHRPWSDPRMHAIVDDGRNYLAATSETFDVIVSEPSNRG